MDQQKRKTARKKTEKKNAEGLTNSEGEYAPTSGFWGGKGKMVVRPSSKRRFPARASRGFLGYFLP